MVVVGMNGTPSSYASSTLVRSAVNTTAPLPPPPPLLLLLPPPPPPPPQDVSRHTASRAAEILWNMWFSAPDAPLGAVVLVSAIYLASMTLARGFWGLSSSGLCQFP